MITGSICYPIQPNANVQILDANPQRLKVEIINASDTEIWVMRQNPAGAVNGIPLNPNGGSLVDEPDAFGNIWKGKWFAYSGQAGKNLMVIETVGY
jgi:hypothetical protein